MTQLNSADIDPTLHRLFDRCVSVPRTTPDGFLATNGLLAMTTAWVLANGVELPQTLPALSVRSEAGPGGVQRYLVLHGAEHAAAATDMEARLSESGLADVQVADLRNMAHGRHVGLAARSKSTAILAMSGPCSNELLERTLACLGDIPTIHLSTELVGAAGAIDMMILSARTFGAIAASLSHDPGQPRVGPRGRRLYHLPWQPQAMQPAVPTSLKQKLLSDTASYESELARIMEARSGWLDQATRVRVKALVLDYDGTCVTTEQRFQKPHADVQEQILRLLDAGLPIGFASGRGKSLPQTLSTWIPTRHHANVIVGIYNGGVIGCLDSAPSSPEGCEGVLALAAELLESELGNHGWKLTRRPTQLTFESEVSSIRRPPPVDLAQSILGHQPDLQLQLQLLKSGHSLDVVPCDVSKTRVITALGSRFQDVIAIGDQGQLGGNDFALLAAAPLSLSVDQVSVDTSRCWNLGRPGERGPELLVRYLKAIKPVRSDFGFRWPKARSLP